MAVVLTSYGPTAIPLRVLPPYLTSFAAGMLLAGAEVATRPGTWCEPILGGVRRLAAKPALCFGLAAGMFVVMTALMPANPSTPAVEFGLERTLQSFVHVVVAFRALTPLALGTTSAPLLEHRALVALGSASFGFYLWHIQVLRLLRPMLQGSDLAAYMGVALAVVSAYLLGEGSRRIIEEPARKILTERARP